MGRLRFSLSDRKQFRETYGRHCNVLTYLEVFPFYRIIMPPNLIGLVLTYSESPLYKYLLERIQPCFLKLFLFPGINKGPHFVL